MKRIFFVLVMLLSANINLAYASSNHSGQVNSKICSTTTKVCVSNVTNALTVKDEELLNACKQCCTITPNIAGVKGCVPRCQKSCEQAYKKEIAKANKHPK